MVDPQIFMGSAIACLCLVGLARCHWLIEQTRKGRRLTERFGEPRSRWILRILLATGMVFGGALAGGLINPVQWN